MQLHPSIDTSSIEHAVSQRSRVGDGFRLVAETSLVEKGDEYLDGSGRFLAFGLEAVGRPVPAGMLVRRIETRRNHY